MSANRSAQASAQYMWVHHARIKRVYALGATWGASVARIMGRSCKFVESFVPRGRAAMRDSAGSAYAGPNVAMAASCVRLVFGPRVEPIARFMRVTSYPDQGKSHAAMYARDPRQQRAFRVWGPTSVLRYHGGNPGRAAKYGEQLSWGEVVWANAIWARPLF